MPSTDQHEEHPVLTEKEDRQQRGDNPAGSFGHTDVPSGDLDPAWTPNDGAKDAAEELIKDIGREHRPRREDVYPYLLIRAYSPGDRAVRPTWPSIPCWESPDILLIDAAHTGPFSLTQLVANPTAGRRYRVFVRVWNLGLFPAIGVHVRGWYVDPGFFGGDPTNPAYQPQFIGMAVVPQLADRTKPGAMQVVELDRTWDIPTTLTGHECLMASVSCPLDEWAGALDANHDHHVGQRNLTILAGADSARSLLGTLGQRVGVGGTLELRHGGAAVTPLLKAILGRTKTEFGTAARMRAPAAKRLRRGVPTGSGQHLLTMFRTDGGWLVADSGRLWDVAVELGAVHRAVLRRSMVGRDGEKTREHPFDAPLGTRRVIEQLGPDRVKQFGVVVDAEPGEALVEGLARLWDLGDLGARDLAAALAEGGPFAHLLRFSHAGRQDRDAGGYSVTIIG